MVMAYNYGSKKSLIVKKKKKNLAGIVFIVNMCSNVLFSLVHSFWSTNNNAVYRQGKYQFRGARFLKKKLFLNRDSRMV